MKQKMWNNWIFGVCLFISGSAFGQENNNVDIPDSVVRKVDPSVVMIQHERAVGSGFVISEDGYIMTNGHVVRGNNKEDPTEPAKSITVVMHDERKYSAEVIGLFMNPDVALIKIEPESDLHPVEIADSRNAQIGQRVFAVGTPSGLKRTFTKGILSNVNRTDLGTLTKVFQTDAAINPGNSGGPLFDSEGRVLGLNTYASIGKNNLGFTIPIHFAMVLKYHFEKHGRFVRADIPIFFISEIYDELALALKVDRGILLSYVMEGSPAFEAGLRTGDIITAIDGKPVSARTRAEILDINWDITIRSPGDSIDFTILRGPSDKREKIEVQAIMQEAEPAINTRQFPGEVKTHHINALGLSYREITRMHRIAIKLSDEPGILSLNPEKGSAAKQAGIASGDLITHVGGVSVKDPASFERELIKHLRKREKYIELTVRRRKILFPTAIAPYYDLAGKKVALVLPPGKEEHLELITRELASTGANLSLTSPDGKKKVSQLPVKLTQIPIKELKGGDLDIIVLVDGENAREMWDDPDLKRVLGEAYQAKKVLAGIGSASLGLLSGSDELLEKKITTELELAEEAGKRGARFTGKEVEKDGNVITTTGDNPEAIRNFLKSLRRYR